MKKIILILFLLSTKLAEGQIINGGFEVWDTTYSDVYSTDLTSLFGVPDLTGVLHNWTSGNGNGYGISQTTDSYSGNYSLIVHNWYSSANSEIYYHDTISSRPLYLKGYFKYITGGADPLAQGIANVALTLFNGVSTDTIAKGAYQFDSTVSFTPFQLNLNYISALTPDSIFIYIRNALVGQICLTSHTVCNLLYLDNLTLTNSPLGIDNLLSDKSEVTIFPNPSINELNVQNNSSQQIQFKLYNSLGEKIINETLTEKTSTINLSSYSNNIYFYQVSNDKHLMMSGKIIKQ